MSAKFFFHCTKKNLKAPKIVFDKCTIRWKPPFIRLLVMRHLLVGVGGLLLSVLLRKTSWVPS